MHLALVRFPCRQVCSFSTLLYDVTPPVLYGISNIGEQTRYSVTDRTSQKSVESEADLTKAFAVMVEDVLSRYS